eukprot:6186309-Pleurochrysis_carterae.AAC.1
MSCQMPKLLDAARRVICYSSNHRPVGLRFTIHDPKPVIGFSDFDFATRHFALGHVFLHGQAAIPWSSKKQATVALSSCETEIVVASKAAKGAIFICVPYSPNLETRLKRQLFEALTTSLPSTSLIIPSIMLDRSTSTVATFLFAKRWIIGTHRSIRS